MILPDNEIPGVVRSILGLGPGDRLELTAMSRRGSERNFFRAELQGSSVIVVNYSPGREENLYFADIARFLNSIGVPVPAIIAHDDSRHIVIMSDLGDSDLWSYRTSPWDMRRALYRSSLEIVWRLHRYPAEKAAVKMMPGFSPDVYRWERDYFRENFVRDFCSLEIDPPDSARLEEELKSLSERIAASGSCLIHRDLQSQNVMVLNSQPYLIDFQGMRTGSFFYDLASFLYDPYVTFGDEERLELLDYYYGISGCVLDWPYFTRMFNESAAQRLMQSLGAYGFLGLKKGLTSFLEHIPAALENLINACGKSGELPLLQETAYRCRGKLKLP